MTTPCDPTPPKTPTVGKSLIQLKTTVFPIVKVLYQMFYSINNHGKKIFWKGLLNTTTIPTIVQKKKFYTKALIRVQVNASHGADLLWTRFLSAIRNVMRSHTHDYAD